MFRIGDFSRLTRVPIKTLRYYDDINLFKPAQIDPFTGYRYYTFDQLPLLNRILALRGIGFSLEQIRQMVGEDGGVTVSADELRGMLILRRGQLQHEMDETLEKLAQVEIRLSQIEQEGIMSEVEVLIKTVNPITIVGARKIVPDPALMRQRCIALNDSACALIAAAHLKTDGISFALYYTAGEQGIDVEMAFAIEPPGREIAPQELAQVHTLPAATVAYAVYRGSFDDFGAVGQVHGAIARWIEANSYRVTDACREYYLRPPQGKNDRNGVMELQYPIERR